MAAVDQNGKLHLFRSSEIHQLVECGADRSSGIEHVIYQDNSLAFDVLIKLGAVYNRAGADGRKIVAIESDVKNPVKRPRALERFDLVHEPLSQRNAAAADADQIKVGSAVVGFDYLGRDPGQGALHPVRVHYPGLFYKVYFVSHLQANRSKREGKVQSRSGKNARPSFNINRKRRNSPRNARKRAFLKLPVMSKLYDNILRPLLFKLSPETAHEIGIESLKLGLASAFAGKQDAWDLGEIERFGLTFKNPLGMAAGFDKNGIVVNQLGALGFGFVEVGTVTYRPQKGNDKPRLFRLPEDSALINRLGFNNEGTVAVVERLRKLERNCVVGVNIGKNKDVPNEEAIVNYLQSFDLAHEVADYIAVNISSPNTPNLRELQKAENLEELLGALQQRNKELGSKALLVKIAPDLTDMEIEAIVDICLGLEISGVIATNTTIRREGLKTDAASIGAGGLSGKPLGTRSTDVISKIYRFSGGRLPIVGVGGIFTAEDAFEKIEAGACLIQAYTGFIYGGISFARDVNAGLSKIIEKNGIHSYDEVVGSST